MYMLTRRRKWGRKERMVEAEELNDLEVEAREQMEGMSNLVKIVPNSAPGRRSRVSADGGAGSDPGGSDDIFCDDLIRCLVFAVAAHIR